MQRTTSTIADVLPSLIIMISKWSRMIVSNKYKNLCKNLILAFKHKFKYELDSPIYCVAALFNVSKLKMCQGRSDCADMRRKGIDNIVRVAEIFNSLKEDLSSSSSVRVPNSSSASTTSSTSTAVDSLNGILEDDDYRDPIEIGDKLLFIKLV